MAVHDKIKPFKCDSCEVEFTFKSSLTIHISAVHEKKKDFKCNSCDKTFSLKYNLGRHFRVVHKETSHVLPATKLFP